MNADNWVFLLIGAAFFGFVALRPRTVFWLLSYGKPNLVPRWVPGTFQIMAYVGLVLLIANAIYKLSHK
jgi:hypothetical protein